jgi:hypothetical protein
VSAKHNLRHFGEEETSMSHRFSAGVMLPLLIIFLSLANSQQIISLDARQVAVTPTILPSGPTPTSVPQTVTTTETPLSANLGDTPIGTWILDFLRILISWPVIFGVALWGFRKPLAQFLGDMGQRATKISIAQFFSVELPASQGPPSVWSGFQLTEALQSSVTGSGAKDLTEQFKNRDPFDHFVVDIDTGNKWLTSRLFLFTTLLQRMNNLRCVVFLCRKGNKPRTFLGIAHAEDIRWVLAREYPWLEAAYTAALAKKSPSVKTEPAKDEAAKGEIPKPKEVSGYILSNTGALDPNTASAVAKDFLEAIQFRKYPDPGADELPAELQNFPKGEWEHLEPKTHELPYWEHGKWLKEDILRIILQSVLLTDAYVINSPDISSSKKQKAIVNRRGRFVALVDEENIFQELINRKALLEEIGRNLAKPVDD